MGIIDDESVMDPKNASADWDLVSSRLETNPKEAGIMHPGGIAFPLNLALCNSKTPVPDYIVKQLIKCYYPALSLEDFGNACRYKHTSGDVMRVLIRNCPGIRREHIKRWDLDWIAQNSNHDVAKVLIEDNCEAANPASIKEWKDMRPSSQHFWLSLLIETKAYAASEDNIKRKRILQFFILQGNLECVELILDTYPSLLSVTSHRGTKTNQLPIHTALSEYNSYQYKPWQNRSPIVKLLLERGIKENIGGSTGCGGLFAKDSSTDALSYGIEASLNSKWDDEERKKCLQVCLQVAHNFMYRRPAEAMPILHAGIGIIRVHTLISLMKKYNISATETDAKGRTALFTLIKLMTDRPENGYTVTRIAMINAKKERERHLDNRDFPRNIGWGIGVDAPVGPFHQQQGRQAVEILVGRLLDREEELLGNIAGNIQLDRWNIRPDPPRPIRRAFLRRRLPPNQNEQEAGQNNQLINNDQQLPENVENANLNQLALDPRRRFVNEADLLRHRGQARNFPGQQIADRGEGNELNAERHAGPRPPVEENNVGELPNAGRNVRNRRVARLRARIRNEVEDDAEDFDLNDNEEAVEADNELVEWRTYAETRNLELDRIQEQIIEKKYFEKIRNILLKEVQCAQVKSHDGRLALHFAAERGLSSSDGLKDIWNAFPDAVLEPDGATGLFPFALTSTRSDLNTTFEILIRNPAVMDFI